MKAKSTILEIHELGPLGDGVHLGPRGRVYVDRAIPGDRVAVEIRTDEQGIKRGEILELVKRSRYRQDAPCPHYDSCGGCTLQHVQERDYRGWKEEVVAEALERQRIKPKEWLPPVFLPGHNRRRATFSAKRLDDRLLVGYHKRRSHLITAVESCLISEPRLFALRETIKPFLKVHLGRGESADVFCQRVGDAVDMVVTGPLARRAKPGRATLDALAPLIEAGTFARASWHARPGDRIVPLAGKRPVVATFGALAVELPPGAFLQPTPDGEAALVSAVLAALPEKGAFADLFSGCGTFSGPMLARGSVDAYDDVGPAIEALAKAGRGKALKAFQRDLFRQPLRSAELNRYDAVVFDPPRAGCEDQARQLAGSRVKTLVGVSCNPATFARDARTLADGGYWLTSVQLVDQFLWSHHVEVVGVFTRRSGR